MRSDKTTYLLCHRNLMKCTSHQNYPKTTFLPKIFDYFLPYSTFFDNALCPRYTFFENVICPTTCFYNVLNPASCFWNIFRTPVIVRKLNITILSENKLIKQDLFKIPKCISKLLIFLFKTQNQAV